MLKFALFCVLSYYFHTKANRTPCLAGRAKVNQDAKPSSQSPKTHCPVRPKRINTFNLKAPHMVRAAHPSDSQHVAIQAILECEMACIARRKGSYYRLKRPILQSDTAGVLKRSGTGLFLVAYFQVWQRTDESSSKSVQKTATCHIY